MDESVRICVVVPTYNERENVQTLVEETKRLGLPGLVILFVDDSSPDGTGKVIGEISTREPWVRVLVRKSKLGIGSAYQDGFKEAIATLSPEILMEMDADLQHPPSLIPDLIKAVQVGADVAVGSRYVEGGSVPNWSLRRRAVSRIARGLASALLGIPVKDSTSGFRAYSRRASETVAEAELPASGFEFQVASLHLLKTKMKIVEVPYSFAPRVAGKSKLGFSDMVKFSLSVIRLALK